VALEELEENMKLDFCNINLTRIFSYHLTNTLLRIKVGPVQNKRFDSVPKHEITYGIEKIFAMKKDKMEKAFHLMKIKFIRAFRMIRYE
jgi:hypothetical protein